MFWRWHPGVATVCNRAGLHNHLRLRHLRRVFLLNHLDQTQAAHRLKQLRNGLGEPAPDGSGASDAILAHAGSMAWAVATSPDTPTPAGPCWWWLSAQSPLESRSSRRRQSSLAKPLRLGVGSAWSSAITNSVFSGAASVCLTDDVDCIAQELQDREGFVPFLFPGQAQG